MRDFDEIVARTAGSSSLFGFDRQVLIPYLPFELAQQFLKPDTTPEYWSEGPEPLPYPLTREHVLSAMSSYMEFALGKAIGHRGISAGRSVEKMEGWIWLLGDDLPGADYPNYGAPILKEICERYGFEGLLPEHDHDDSFTLVLGMPNPGGEHEWCDRCRFERMAAGASCRSGCNEGCGR